MIELRNALHLRLDEREHVRPRAIALGLTTVALALVLALASPAQIRFATLQRDHLPMDAGNTFETVFADVDDDGDLDLVIGKDRADVLMINDGTGVFTDESFRLPRLRRDTTGLEAVDVDGDGDFDLVVGRAFSGAQQNELWLNDGSGRFTNATGGRLPSRLDVTSHVDSGDVDGDGDADLVFGNTRQNTLYLNDGAGFFTDVTATHMPASTSTGYGVTLVDVDDDGDLDLVTPGLGDLNRLYLNDGNGVFTDVTAAQMPGQGDYNNQVRAGDVDGDGDPDLVLCAFFGRQTRLYVNDGNGFFTDVTATHMPPDTDWATDLDLDDVDGDGDLDVVIGNGDVTPQDRLYLNDGSGVFSDATAALMPADAEWANAIRLGDVDGDGDPDLVTGHPVPDSTDLYLNDGSGRFHDATERSLSRVDDRSNAVVIGDVNGDGAGDLVFGNSGQNRLMLGDATGRFGDVTPQAWPIDAADTRDVLLLDVDADGDLDAILGNSVPTPTQQYENDGAGVFVDVSSTRMPAVTMSIRSLASGDVDGDGDDDLVLAGQSDCRLYLNDGAGTFTDETTGRVPPVSQKVQVVALGDVDGDGDPDLVLGSDGWQNRLLINDGAGSFGDETSARMPVETERTFALVLADTDGDADLDLVLGAFAGFNKLYENDGSGTFTDASAKIPGGPRGAVFHIAAADADLDGDVDLFFAQGSGRNRYYENAGAGQFTDATASLPVFVDDSRAVAFGDLDTDGDPDIAVANHDLFGNSVLLNRHRHLRAPLLMRRGRAFELQLELTPRSLLVIGAGVLGTGEAGIPVPPFGMWRVLPQGSVPLPLIYVPPGTRSASLPIAVPNEPGLRGIALYIQMFFIDPLGGSSLSNLVVETVL